MPANKTAVNVSSSNSAAKADINTSSILYIIGDANTKDSYRMRINPVDSTIHLERRVNGVWKPATIDFGYDTKTSDTLISAKTKTRWELIMEDLETEEEKDDTTNSKRNDTKLHTDRGNTSNITHSGLSDVQPRVPEKY